MKNKGVTLVELLALILISSIILISLSRLMLFLFTAQNITNSTNRLVNEGGIIINEIIREFDEVKPDSISENNGILTLTGSTSSMTLEVIDYGNGTQAIFMNGVALEHTTFMTNAVITEMVCIQCPAQKLYKIEFELYMESSAVTGGFHSKEFMTSLSIFRGF